MVPLVEAAGWPAVLPVLAPLELLLLELLLLVVLELVVVPLAAPQAGMPAMAGCDEFAHAPAVQLHHMQLLFSW